MLLSECQAHHVDRLFGVSISSISRDESGFHIVTEARSIQADKLVIATGGLSIPKIGATSFGYDVARQFGLSVVPVRAGLVPLTFTDGMKQRCANLSGLSVEANVKWAKTTFSEGLLFTHRGLSGPSILQISSYWQEGSEICVNLVPDTDMHEFLRNQKYQAPRRELHSVLSEKLPKRLAGQICESHGTHIKLGDISDKNLDKTAEQINSWHVRPAGTEGYRTAEVTIGGVDTKDLSSKDMQAKNCPGLYFIGEVVDVTGHLGGHNFQWAWASAYAVASHL